MTVVLAPAPPACPTARRERKIAPSLFRAGEQRNADPVFWHLRHRHAPPGEG